MQDQIVPSGESATIKTNTFTAPSGCAFAGWTTSITGPGTSYSDQATFTMGNGDATLYAVWLPTTLIFASSGNAIVVTGFASKPTGEFAIPFGVTSLGESAFIDCAAMTSVTIPTSVTTIGNTAFLGCSALTSVTIPASVTTIGSGAFAGCEQLASVTISSGVASINSFAFERCYALTSVAIPESVTTILSPIFDICFNLASIQVDAGNPSYSSVSGILFDKAKTTLIEVPKGMDLGSYEIPEGVTSIGKDAFKDCGSLTRLTIPSSVASIGQYCIFSCGSLSSIYVRASSPPELGSGNFGALDPAFVIYVPSASLSAYQNADNWSDYSSHMQGY